MIFSRSIIALTCQRYFDRYRYMFILHSLKSNITFLMKFLPIQSAINSLILLLAAACATPTSPTGGPPDEEGPQIVFTEPQAGTTNFEGRSITFHFSEFINRGSITSAIVVEPDVGI